MKEPFILAHDLLWLEPWMLEHKELVAGFTTTSGPLPGNNNIAYHVQDDPKTVLSNRQWVAERVGTRLHQWVFAEQLHTTRIHKVTSKDLGAGVHDFESGIKATDGLYTTERDITLATFYADCTPLYFFAPKHHLIGVAHAGWRGTVNGMMHEMLQTLKMVEGILAQDIWVAIGPCIGRDAYRVDDVVIQEVLKSPVPQVTDTFVALGQGQYKFDSKLLNKKQALFEGIPANQILVSSYCTYTDKDLFSSYRRNGLEAGRMMAFMTLKSK